MYILGTSFSFKDMTPKVSIMPNMRKSDIFNMQLICPWKFNFVSLKKHTFLMPKIGFSREF